MLVYDITSEKSFENIKNWIRNIEEVSFVFILYNQMINWTCSLIILSQTVSQMCCDIMLNVLSSMHHQT